MTAGVVSETPVFNACPADGVRTEFGVCRGEPLRQIDDLMLGDIYMVKPSAEWTEVRSSDEEMSGFNLELAANLPTIKMHTLAQLIFMSTTGRRADVFATATGGRLYFVSETGFAPGVGYVLIDIEQRRFNASPATETIPTVADTPATPEDPRVVTLRRQG